ncbi:hypothetical protein [Caulobacter soli]|uniref:hypothetical protein n=1 Tax=Caulobacter soli TaxID=2708539 RepID=UPI0013EAAA3B|nr:hypothetical protein [Caulobacter soli]
MINPGNKTTWRRDVAQQSAQARQLADSLSVLKIFLQQERRRPTASDSRPLAGALAVIAALEDLHEDLARDARELAVICAADELASLCARTSAAMLEPLGLQCEALIEDGPMRAVDFALLRQVLPIVLAGAGRHVFPVGVARNVRVRIGQTLDGWCCAVMHLGVATGPEAQGVATGLDAARAVLEAAGGQLRNVAGPGGAAILIMLGQAPADPLAPRTSVH